MKHANFFFFFETGSPYITQVGLELMNSLIWSLECWDYRHFTNTSNASTNTILPILLIIITKLCIFTTLKLSFSIADLTFSKSYSLFEERT
jgi:hypothetical protein